MVVIMLMMMLALPVTSEDVSAQSSSEVPTAPAMPSYTGNLIIYSANGDGDYDDLAAAISAARNSDTVLIRTDASIESLGIINYRFRLLGETGRETIDVEKGGRIEANFTIDRIHIDLGSPLEIRQNFTLWINDSTISADDGVAIKFMSTSYSGPGDALVVTDSVVEGDPAIEYGPRTGQDPRQYVWIIDSTVSGEIKFQPRSETAQPKYRLYGKRSNIGLVNMENLSSITEIGDFTRVMLEECIIEGIVHNYAWGQLQISCDGCLIKSANHKSLDIAGNWAIGGSWGGITLQIIPESKVWNYAESPNGFALTADMVTGSTISIFGLRDGYKYYMDEGGLRTAAILPVAGGAVYEVDGSGTVTVTAVGEYQAIPITIGIAAIFIAAGLVIALLWAAAAGWRRR